MFNNTLADAIARIRNAFMVLLPKVTLRFSNHVVRVLSVLKREGFVKDWEIIEENKKKFIVLNLKYHNNKSVITEIKAYGKNHMKSIKSDAIVHNFLSERSLILLTTNRGIKSLYEARQEKIGGQLIMEVY